MAVNKLFLEPDGLVVGATQLVTSGGGVYIGQNLVAQGNIYATNFVGNVNNFALGYRDMPQVTAGNVTLTTTDGGKHYYSTSSANIILTIPTNDVVGFPIGTAIMIINKGPGYITVLPQATNIINLFLAGNTISNTSRTISNSGLASLIKTETNVWFISGVGVY
jgi:hypothetical protein